MARQDPTVCFSKPMGRKAILAAFESSHSQILALCQELEQLADALPNRLDAACCRSLAESLVPLLKHCHDTEENGLSRSSAAKMRTLETSLERLRSEHKRDQYFAEDVAEALCQLSDVCPPRNPEALGFMLRSLFEPMRRHVAFEREVIIPALRAGISIRSHAGSR